MCLPLFQAAKHVFKTVKLDLLPLLPDTSDLVETDADHIDWDLDTQDKDDEGPAEVRLVNGWISGGLRQVREYKAVVD